MKRLHVYTWIVYQPKSIQATMAKICRLKTSEWSEEPWRHMYYYWSCMTKHLHAWPCVICEVVSIASTWIFHSQKLCFSMFFPFVLLKIGWPVLVLGIPPWWMLWRAQALASQSCCSIPWLGSLGRNKQIFTCNLGCNCYLVTCYHSLWPPRWGLLKKNAKLLGCYCS